MQAQPDDPTTNLKTRRKVADAGFDSRTSSRAGYKAGRGQKWNLKVSRTVIARPQSLAHVQLVKSSATGCIRVDPTRVKPASV
jgi:hypothetical protein